MEEKASETADVCQRILLYLAQKGVSDCNVWGTRQPLLLLLIPVPFVALTVKLHLLCVVNGDSGPYTLAWTLLSPS